MLIPLNFFKIWLSNWKIRQLPANNYLSYLYHDLYQSSQSSSPRFPSYQQTSNTIYINVNDKSRTNSLHLIHRLIITWEWFKLCHLLWLHHFYTLITLFYRTRIQPACLLMHCWPHYTLIHSFASPCLTVHNITLYMLIIVRECVCALWWLFTTSCADIHQQTANTHRRSPARPTVCSPRHSHTTDKMATIRL